MRHLLLLPAFLFPSPSSGVRSAALEVRAEVEVRVDPRVELLCAIARVAGFDEYRQGRVEAYARAVDEWFGPLSDHEAMAMARRLRGEVGLGFDAVIQLAVHLDPETFAPLRPFDGAGLVLTEDARWSAKDAEAFAAAVCDLAELSELPAFLDENAELLAVAERRARETVVASTDLGWFERFYGRPPGAPFTLVLGLQTGGANYGARFRDADGVEHLYAVLGVSQTDDAGVPRFGEGHVGTVVHEFTHSYANPIVDAHADALEEAGNALFERQRAIMEQQAYGSGRIVLYESLVRACSARYALEHGGEEAGCAAVDYERGRGFLWIDGLFDLLGEYERERETYPTLDDFAPRLIAFFEMEARGGAR